MICILMPRHQFKTVLIQIKLHGVSLVMICINEWRAAKSVCRKFTIHNYEFSFVDINGD